MQCLIAKSRRSAFKLLPCTIIATANIFRDRLHTGPSSPIAQIAPVFYEGVERALSRKWRSVDTSTLRGMERWRVEVDEDEFGPLIAGQNDPVVDLLQDATKFMLQTGGAIPLIIHDLLNRPDWQIILEESSHKELDFGDDVNTSLLKIFEVLDGKLIRIFGSKSQLPPYVSRTVEGSARWSLEASEFQSGSPNINNAQLYVFIKNVYEVNQMSDRRTFALRLVGHLRVLIHEFIHGIRMLKRLMDCFGSLTWSQNQFHDWCVDKDEFNTKLSTPPRLGPAPLVISAYPADAGRTWEHSITYGKAFFQGGFEVMMCFNGKFIRTELLSAEGFEVLNEPRKLIDISRRCVSDIEASEGLADRYRTNSEAVSTFDYQCPGSARWTLDHIDQLHSWRTAPVSSNTVGEEG